VTLCGLYVCCCRTTPLLLPPRTWNLLTWTCTGHPATPVLTRWSLLLDAECSTSTRYAKLARCHFRDQCRKPLCLSLLLCRELNLAVAWAAWTQWKHLPLTSHTWTSQRTWRAVWIVQNRWAHVWSRFPVIVYLLYRCPLARQKFAEALQFENMINIVYVFAGDKVAPRCVLISWRVLLVLLLQGNMSRVCHKCHQVRTSASELRRVFYVGQIRRYVSLFVQASTSQHHETVQIASHRYNICTFSSLIELANRTCASSQARPLLASVPVMCIQGKGSC